MIPAKKDALPLPLQCNQTRYNLPRSGTAIDVVPDKDQQVIRPGIKLIEKSIQRPGATMDISDCNHLFGI